VGTIESNIDFCEIVKHEKVFVMVIPKLEEEKTIFLYHVIFLI
jgi:hypothetical protein